MRGKFTALLSLSALLVATVGVLLPVSQAQAVWAKPQDQSPACAEFSGSVPPATGLTTGSTDGLPATFSTGAFITISATLGTATAGSFSIVGNGSGSPVLSGPTAIPGTLSYLVTGPLPAGSIGIGYYIDSATGGTVNISATSCVQEVSLPATNRTGLFTLAFLLCLFGLVAVRKTRSLR